MSLQAALQFIQRAQKEPELRDEVKALRIEADLERLVELGAEVGLCFSVDELRRAHRLDWSMRQVYYTLSPRGETPRE